MAWRTIASPGLHGWIRFHRKTLESQVWALPATHVKVWLTVLLLANNADRTWVADDLEEIIPRGSFITSQDNLARVTGVTRKVVRQALSNLEKIGSLVAKARSNRFTMISLVNFDTYQHRSDEEGQQLGQPEGQPRANRGPRREKEEGRSTTTTLSADADPVKDPLYSDPFVTAILGSNGLAARNGHGRRRATGSSGVQASARGPGFTRFYDGYPRKVDHLRALAAWTKQGLETQPAVQSTIAADVQRRLDSGEWETMSERIQYIPYPASYLNGRRWEDKALAAASNGHEAAGGDTERLPYFSTHPACGQFHEEGVPCPTATGSGGGRG